ncbi:MAG TPA: succinylglutamate desuccinylase/aspartoacylase family protein [Stellaceae bacterium]|nr:succinylglutamate desuccinylase/aspartoacylase family protein [Stellaceae bacterium]
MARSQSRLTAEIDFDREGRQHGFIRLPHSVHRSAYGWIPIPVVSIKHGEGPRVLLMAGNHGDEYEGQVALGRLIRTLDPGAVRGRLIILPSANSPAAMAGTRTSPLDDGNLNRSFPGDPYGGPTAQIAHYIESVLLPQCDYVCDFHSGGSSLTYIPSALLRRGQTPEELDWGIRMLRCFGAPIGYLVDGGWGDHTLTAAAARAGVKHLGTEIAGGGQVTPSALKILESGLRRVLVEIGALAVEPPPPAVAETRIMQVRGGDYYVYASEPGLFEPLVELGDEVAAGTPAALIHPHDTPWREPAPAAFARAGMVICKRVPGRVERGDCLYHLAADFEP